MPLFYHTYGVCRQPFYAMRKVECGMRNGGKMLTQPPMIFKKAGRIGGIPHGLVTADHIRLRRGRTAVCPLGLPVAWLLLYRSVPSNLPSPVRFQRRRSIRRALACLGRPFLPATPHGQRPLPSPLLPKKNFKRPLTGPFSCVIVLLCYSRNTITRNRR